MDVQSESSETPLCDPQPPGKIRKAFKLFGKRKPGSIFSIRGKGEGNNKSPIARSKTVDGLTESTAAESELEKDKEPEKEQEPEVSQREEQEPEEEPLGDDGDPSIPSAGHPSTSSMTSAKSLSFLMKLQRSRQGGADRRFHTESQPTVRQRRGLKGLFGSMGWNQREEASDEADTPPSPLLMSSRTNSVEIIKEDMTFTSRPAPHILDVPEPEPGQESPVSSKSPTVQESSASSPPETTALSAATYSVTGSNEDVPPPLPTTEPPPLDPAVDRLRLLLADISSLISFDSLTGCGDITAEVEAEWGKASTTVGTGPGTKGAVVVEKASSTTLSAKPTPITKPTPSPTPIPAPAAATKSSTTPIPMLTSTFRPTPSSARTTKPTSTFTPITKPEPTSWSIKPEPTPIATTKPSTTPTTITSPTTKSSPTPLTKPSPPPTTKCTPSPAPIGITATSPPITPPFTATSTFKPAPVVTPSIPPAPVVTPSIPAAPVVTPSIPPAPVVTPSIPAAPVVTPSIPAAPVVTPSIPAAPVVTPSIPAAPVVTPSIPPAPVVTPSIPPAPVVTPSPPPTPPPVSKPTPVITPSPAPAPVAKPAPVTTPDTLSSATVISAPPPKISSVPCLDSTTAPPSLTSFYPTAVPNSAFKMPYIPVPVPASFTSPAPVQTPSPILTDSKAPPAPTPTPIPMSKTPTFPTPAPTPTPIPMSKTPTFPTPAPTTTPIPMSKTPTFPTPAPTTTPVPMSKTAPVSTPSTVPSPVLTPAPLHGTPLASAQVEGGERNASLNRGEDMTSRNGMDVRGARNNSPNREEKLHVTQNETHMVPQGPPTEKKTPPVREAWLSKIPVCGGGRVGKLPLRESQPTDNKGSWDPPITGQEEGSQRPSLWNGVSKDTISNSSAEAEVEASLPPVKHSPEESRHLRQPTVYRSIPRDSKIPVKLGVQSNIPVPQGTKEPPRSKIPLSKVPVRRIGNKLTATTAASAQIRK